MANAFKSKYKKLKKEELGDETSERRINQCTTNDRIDEKFGFTRMEKDEKRTTRIGFMINMHTTEVLDENRRLVSAVDYYFLEEDGSRFKASIIFQPYFYVLAKIEGLKDLASHLEKKYNGVIIKVEVISKEDLDLPNHLVGLKQRFLKLIFPTMSELMKVRRELLAVVRKSREASKNKALSLYSEMMSAAFNSAGRETRRYSHPFDNIIDIREYDVPYHVRVSIDVGLFAGCWYSVESRGTHSPIITRRPDIIETPDLIVLAFDIECTKQPLKFPDADADEIMMISYMIDGRGYLLNNREVLSSDVDDFEYTPHPEFEGNFVVRNEVNEKAVLERFFEHIADVRPHVIVTYNGDMFDWPYVEKRAAINELAMDLDTGFASSGGKDSYYTCRPIMHMDCLWWVKRDSYLPVGSQNLKAVAKAKLRYDPVEIDPEDMCRMAAEDPQTMSNYSVSDAVATYYLYMKYVHPFIFALCTILPMEPDEVLRKGSGTLCEALLMVEAFHANIIFPNKQEQELNKMTSDGHVLDSETYVGGHVEALESGVFRADLPCGFRLVPEAFQMLIEGVNKALCHAIVEEENVPLDQVTNLDQVVGDIIGKLTQLQEQPIRVESPVILHLDVGAMYPNIILTNRLQPSAVVDEETCAACDFNRAGAKCQRNMKWMWRGEIMPANKSEFQRVQQQLETEKFPSNPPGGPPRAFHQLTREEAAAVEKKRLAEYCRSVYKKVHETRMEERTTTICQKENSFYVDTVRAFRDRRYEYKGLCKDAKRQVSAAIAGGDAREIKSAKNREVLYDSLQLAHKCILNSFYGYVMRRGARWHSMEMAGIVCHTGAAIITEARQLIEQIGRPLELDTDGIWCILPESFPQNFTVLTTHEKKKKLNISYPNAVLNYMVKQKFTNDVYHELVDPAALKYEIRSENSIFFEVDGPYLAMVLPASKEEGKKLKKRYAVFNFDKSLAELKGFEVKRRGELQLIKIFQSSVFEAFLKGDTLEKCYEAVAKIANYWLDVLYTKAYNLPDTELFELISEKKSMSRKLEDYGAQKSTSISTAKRLAEFLGDQMVKDKGLACRFIISRRPESEPVTSRAIPLAIFQSEPSIKRHYLRKWLKDSSITDIDIREVLDWNYYIERLNGAIQKIITIPAALQGLNNPVPRVRHPDWLHKKVMEKNDVFKQRKMNDFFKQVPKPVMEQAEDQPVRDIEDFAKPTTNITLRPPVVGKKRKRGGSAYSEDELSRPWREVLGPRPDYGPTREDHVKWLEYHKKKWALQLAKKQMQDSGQVRKKSAISSVMRTTASISSFIKKAQRTILDSDWQVIQFAETNEPGLFRAWVLVEKELHVLKVTVPRIFYVNQRSPRSEPTEEVYWKKANRQLPRSRPTFYLYEYTVPEPDFKQHSQELLKSLPSPDIEGIYETEVPLEFRLLVTVGCVCAVDRKVARRLVKEGMKDIDTFSMLDLNFRSLAQQPYLENLPDGSPAVKHVFLYQHTSANAQRSLYGVFLAPVNKAVLFVLDSVRSNQMPNLQQLYTTERNARMAEKSEEDLPGAELNFEVQLMTDPKQLYRALQKVLLNYRDEKRGPTMVVVQVATEMASLIASMPSLTEFPLVPFHIHDPTDLYSTIEWQRVGAKQMIQHYINLIPNLTMHINQCRYFHVPIGNLPMDVGLFGADIFFARHLLKNNLALWCSPSPLPDLGGRQADDGRLLSELDDCGNTVINVPGAYTSICIELTIDGLAVNTLLQSRHIHDVEGTSSSIAFDAGPQGSVDEMLGAATPGFTSYDETALCSPAFRVLRSTVSAWLRDVSVYENKFADQQLVHFYRWLRSPNALLYEPALRRSLLHLMKKLFIQIISELRRLGCVVISADFSKINICSRKLTVSDALGHMKYVLQSIRNKELFHSIHISVSQCWEYLLWLDDANYGGVRGIMPETEEVTSDTNDIADSEAEEECRISMTWSLGEILPEEAKVRENFLAVVAGFINAIWKKMREEGRTQLAIASPERRATPGEYSQLETDQLGVGILETLKIFTEELVSGELSQKLFKLVEEINRKLPTAKATALGAEGRKIVPALEFTKAVTRVLSLDSAVPEAISRIRRNMLKLLGIGEFSSEAEWSDTCVPAILPEVICKVCNHCRDLNLCKDPHRVLHDGGKPAWLCPLCQSVYDSAEIEYQLLDSVQRKMISFNLQDIQCTKCHAIQADNFSEHCACAGAYTTLLPTVTLTAYLATLESVASHFQLPLLLETIRNIRCLTR